MKILKKVTIILIIFLSVFTVKTFASTGKINVSATRLRKEKNTTSDIITKIYEDEEVEILEDFGEWIKVKYEGKTGYIKKEFVTIKEEKEKDKVSNYENSNQSSQTTNEIKTTQNCILRIMPNFMSKEISELKKDTNLTILTQMNQWVKVTDGKNEGWILKNKLNSNESSVQVEPSDLETTNTVQNSNTVNNTTSTNTTKNNTTKNNVTNTNQANITNTIKDNTTSNNTVTNNTTNQSTITSVSKKGKVNVETANVRKEPSTSAKRIDFLDEGDIVTISEETEEWYKVKHEDIEGYVSKELITLIKQNETISSRSLEEERNANSSNENTSSVEQESVSEEVESVTGKEVVEYAKKYLGYKYVSGGKTPETGFDCSGFTRYIYKNFGYNLASVSYEQTSVGEEVSRENLQPGDLILFYNDAKTKIGHTGIYVGNGDFIHAANAERGVVYDNINTVSYYNERFVTARRIVK